MRPIQVECFIIFNDDHRTAIKQLRENAAGLIAAINADAEHLFLQVRFFQKEFETLYEEVKSVLYAGRYPNVLFNLDQYGYSDVNIPILNDIMSSWPSAEIFLTFAIKTLLTYFSADKQKNSVLAREPKLRDEIYSFIQSGGEVLNKKQWLRATEKIVFENLKTIAPFVSPFSIHNPHGWRYWLIHFANRSRARQVYNDILHDNSTSQVHVGRFGLRMLAYNPLDEVRLYLFDDNSREQAIHQLHTDIPRRISEHGDTLSIDEFYIDIYKETAAHSSDIHKTIIDHEDIEVLTSSGSERRKAHTIKPTDTIRLKQQRSFFPMFPQKNS